MKRLLPHNKIEWTAVAAFTVWLAAEAGSRALRDASRFEGTLLAWLSSVSLAAFIVIGLAYSIFRFRQRGLSFATAAPVAGMVLFCLGLAAVSHAVYSFARKTEYVLLLPAVSEEIILEAVEQPGVVEPNLMLRGMLAYAEDQYVRYGRRVIYLDQHQQPAAYKPTEEARVRRDKQVKAIEALQDARAGAVRAMIAWPAVGLAAVLVGLFLPVPRKEEENQDA